MSTHGNLSAARSRQLWQCRQIAGKYRRGERHCTGSSTGSVMNEPAVDLKSSLAQALHNLLSTPRRPEKFLRDVSELSASSAESPWETLAFLDQSFRCGKLSADLFRTARTQIERRALGLHEPVAVPEQLGDKKPLAIVSSALVTVARPEPAPIPTTPAKHEAELAALRVELEQARKQAAMYRERLATSESRTNAALLSVGDHLQREDRLDGDARNHRWFTVSARRIALLAVLAGIVMLSPTNNRSPTSSVPQIAPIRTTTVAAPIAPPPATPGQLRLAAERYIVLPGQAQATIAVERTGGTAGAVSIRYWTVDLGARIGRDFLPRGGGTVTIPDGQDNAKITISILPARQRRHIELFELRIGNPSAGASLGKTVRTTVFLLPP